MAHPYCFAQALVPLSKKNPTQLDEEALTGILEHFTGARHPDDTTTTLPSPVRLGVPWLVSLRHIAVFTTYVPFTDHTEYKVLLNASATGDLTGFREALGKIKDLDIPSLVQPASCLAAQNEQVPLLQCCLVEEGAVFDDELNQACKLGAKSEPMLKLLREKNWLSMNDSLDTARRAIETNGRDTFAGKWIHENIVVKCLYQGSTEYMGPPTVPGMPDRRMFSSGDEYYKALTDDQKDLLSGADVWTGLELERNFGDINW